MALSQQAGRLGSGLGVSILSSRAATAPSRRHFAPGSVHLRWGSNFKGSTRAGPLAHFKEKNYANSKPKFLKPGLRVAENSGFKQFGDRRGARSAAVSARKLRPRPALPAPKEQTGPDWKPVPWENVPRMPDLFPIHESFADRHIGPDEASQAEMLKALDPPAESLEEFVEQVIPPDIRAYRDIFPPLSDRDPAPVVDYATKHGYQEDELKRLANVLSERNKPLRSFIGCGYYGTKTPEVIKRNVLENPAWYTSYTPYQPEISQGRLESLLNFQTMVSDLTALPIANASLLDEGTAAAEALTMTLNSVSAAKAQQEDKIYVVDENLFPQTLNVLKSRALALEVNIVQMDLSKTNFKPSKLEQFGKSLLGVMVQYPNKFGQVHDWRWLADTVHKQGGLLSVATDLLALTLLTPPGEFGADIAFGNSQRFGVPLGFGGPHAAFFATTEKLKRKMPGRLVGVSKDRLGRPALRLALQTREQHIRREKATSNVCTAQALLANMSALYAVYHGPDGLRKIAERCNLGAKAIQLAANHFGFDAGMEPVPFDTVTINCQGKANRLVSMARREHFQIMRHDDNMVSISIDEATHEGELLRLVRMFREAAKRNLDKEEQHKHDGEAYNSDLLMTFLRKAQSSPTLSWLPDLRRQSRFLTHPVFNTHHSETELLRYIHHLQSKDLSLVHSMIPLGSCTMKLNGSTEMSLITDPGFADVHPFSGPNETKGYQWLVRQLERQLMYITAMDGVSLQPNSGAQGEFAGLLAIRRYYMRKGEELRDICLIPVSAHGTNPASAAMAGMRVVPIKCDPATGNLDLADLQEKCEQHSNRIAAIMITYPSTYGVFEPHIKMVCDMVHSHGGQVYMDGANMNAQIGLCYPGEIGADVCHLNLHKTFCIPHGGGGPGVGPICVKRHLLEFLPTRETRSTWKEHRAVSSAPYGSAGILPISWAYNSLMGRSLLNYFS